MKINLLKISAISALFLFENPAFAEISKTIEAGKLPKRSMLMPQAHAQQKVSGTVLDENDQPVPGATVKNISTGITVQADINGRFNIEASSGNILRITFIGYAQQDITIGTQPTVTIKLAPSNNTLN